MQVYRRMVLTLAHARPIEQAIRRNGASKRLVSRFVAGEDLESALAVARRLSRLNLMTTLDQLGEHVRTPAEATTASANYVRVLEALAASHLEPNISVKLTMLGLDLSDDVARENMLPILATARRVGGFVRIDMESSAYTERTMRIFEDLHDTFPAEVGIVIQAYLRRARDDVERMIERRARVRLVKGAYAEPESIAYQSSREIREQFRSLMELLLQHGTYPAIATHDESLIRATQEFASSRQIGPDRYEFQMLYGVRRDAQVALVADGYRMRIYVPFGSQWYPYFVRRIAERPANALFVLRQVIGG
ncbi:MAG: proline dehydrogenase [Thermomicrobiales bacterium]|nr:MAG: proline dehydrogenase [Thermomicrobiales bacterium]